MPIAKIDKINKLRSIPYDKYFGEMQLNNRQKAERIALAEDIEDLMLVLFVLLPEYIDRVDEIKSMMYRDYISLLSDRVVVDETLDSLIKKTIDEVTDTTIHHLSEKTPSYVGGKEDNSSQATNTMPNDNSYWLSQDRAVVIAENEANAVFNYSDYTTAIENGYTKKRWLTELDNRVRETHIAIEGETVDIDDVFVVGNSLMKYPKDTSYNADAREIVGCRCVCEYIK